MKLVHRFRADGFCVAQRKQLRAARRQRVEAWYACSALRHGIWIIENEIVGKVVRREHSPARVDANTRGTFVVAQSLVVGRSGEYAHWCVRSRNVLEQALRRNRPGGLRDLSAGKDTFGVRGAIMCICLENLLVID